MKKQICLRIVFLIIFIIINYYQVYSQDLIGVAGNYQQTENISLCWSLGELSTETLSESLTLTQGFQQPQIEQTTKLNNNLSVYGDVIIYPNPVTNTLSIESKMYIESISIINEYGQVVISKKTIFSNKIDFSAYKSGIYVLIAYNNKGKTIGRFKVIKI